MGIFGPSKADLEGRITMLEIQLSGEGEAYNNLSKRYDKVTEERNVANAKVEELKSKLEAAEYKITLREDWLRSYRNTVDGLRARAKQLESATPVNVGELQRTASEQLETIEKLQKENERLAWRENLACDAQRRATREVEELKRKLEAAGKIEDYMSPASQIARIMKKEIDTLREDNAMMKSAIENGSLTISKMVHDAHTNAIDKGRYEEPRQFGELIALIHSELSEALEDHRNGKGFKEVWYEGKNSAGMPLTSAHMLPGLVEKPCGIPSELADVVIRVGDLAGHLGIDLEGAITEKMRYNATRPHRHGGKKL
jgi:NTP pyrophosphatase (non-canonical NTP hydrolase)